VDATQKVRRFYLSTNELPNTLRILLSRRGSLRG
jgi:hypothetical protein